MQHIKVAFECVCLRESESDWWIIVPDAVANLKCCRPLDVSVRANWFIMTRHHVIIELQTCITCTRPLDAKFQKSRSGRCVSSPATWINIYTYTILFSNHAQHVSQREQGHVTADQGSSFKVPALLFKAIKPPSYTAKRLRVHVLFGNARARRYGDISLCSLDSGRRR